MAIAIQNKTVSSPSLITEQKTSNILLWLSHKISCFFKNLLNEKTKSDECRKLRSYYRMEAIHLKIEDNSSSLSIEELKNFFANRRLAEQQLDKSCRINWLNNYVYGECINQLY